MVWWQNISNAYKNNCNKVKMEMAIVFLLLFTLPMARSIINCPNECSCGFNFRNQLETLCVKGGMRNVPVNSIDQNTQVIIINGPRNTINIGPLFSTFQQLEVLRITDSNVPAIGKNSFWGVISLRVLDLSKNNLTIINDDNFRGQDGLIELDLSNNRIHGMASGTFYHLKSLRRLNLAHNSIEYLVPRLFYMLSKLIILDLSGNTLSGLQPDVFKDVLELRELRLRNCNLKKINPQIYNLLQQLIELDLGDNELKFLEKDEFRDLKRLKRLRLDGNRISVIIDKLFVNQLNLKLLDVSRNLLAKVTTDAFLNLTNLQYLDLSYNKLVRLESDSVEPLKNLTALNISGNVQMDLYEITETFTFLHKLKLLSIADMGPIPFALLTQFDHLKSLNISGNHLMDNVSVQILHPVVNGLELLDLSRNQLNGFGLTQLKATTLRNIKDVLLDNNPLICDQCHMGALINIAQSLSWQTYPICFLPQSLRGASIANLDLKVLERCISNVHDEDYDAASTSHNFLSTDNVNILAIVCSFAFILLACFAIISAYLSKHRARYYTNEEKRADDPLEKGLDPNSTITAGNEISFIFPMDDPDCTVDDMMVLPPPPPPPALSKPSNGIKMRPTID